MKNLGKIIAAIALTAMLFTTFATKAEAQTKENCVTGAYGTIVCKEQPESTPRTTLKHYTAPAGIDSTTLNMLVATLSSTAGVSFIALKKRAQ